mmetsp:Transcript_29960/g.54582  ORF Transcript_29960/g.54582 Transcript_29960/m.54582 type:complete len:420 (-) Transcript_29960:53-1312(-)
MFKHCAIAASYYIAVLDAALPVDFSRSVEPVQHEHCGLLNMAQNLPPARAVAKLGSRYANHVLIPTWLLDAKKNIKHKRLEHAGQDQEPWGSQPYDWDADDEAAYVSVSEAMSKVDGRDNLFMNNSGIPVGMSQAQYDETSAMSEPVWIFSSYHKTGTVLIMKLIWALTGGKDAGFYHEVGPALCDGTTLFSSEPWSNAYSHPYMPVVRVLPNYQFVHFIRDPIHLVVSAYRYHRMSHEQWLFVKRINQADSGQAATSLHLLEELGSKYGFSSAQKRALAHFRLAARRGLTVLDYYQAAPEEEGVIIQAFHSWPDIHLIVQNYEATRQDPNALQIRTESTQTDFIKSMRCMLDFLSESRQIDIKEALRIIEPLDMANNPDMEHVTQGKFDNDNIIAVLKGMKALVAARHALEQPAVNAC